MRLIFILFACGQVGQQQQEVTQAGEGRRGGSPLSCRYVRADKRKLHLMSADSQKRYKRDRQILRQLAGLIICNRLMPPAYGHRVRQTDRQSDRRTDRVETVSQLVRLATPTWNGQTAKRFSRAANRCLAYEMSSDLEHEARGMWQGHVAELARHGELVVHIRSDMPRPAQRQREECRRSEGRSKRLVFLV